jgi:alkylated DNA repair protein (DNA oxidative demethylase)
MTLDLFDGPSVVESWQEQLGPSAVMLRGFAASDDTTLLAALQDVIAMAPFRHMITPGGFRMSVAMTNCSSFGWVMDRIGYRYDPVDPESGDN